ncbi:MAG: hypothetical protein KDC98_13775 [Planctomycetes bacterium]|nr:hypothetical protein [Planctomycetota bacterium]
MLVGRWEPVEKSLGGVCAVLELLKDGTFVSGMAVQVDMNYSLEGGKLSVMFHGSEVMDGVDVEFFGERMMIAGEPVRMRIGGPVAGSAPMVGVWTYEHYTGVPAYERYGSDGELELRIALSGETRGRWMLAGDILTLDTGGTLDVSACEISGDLLTIAAKVAGGRSRTLRRTEPWYDFPLTVAKVEKLRVRALRRQ